MLSADVGGTFTDVVALRDGELSVTKVAGSKAEPARPVVEGAARLGLEGHAIFNHASTAGLNAVITRELPKIGFLTTEGHRDMLDRGQIWRPPTAQTDPAWRRSFGDAGRPLVPRYLRRGVAERILADGTVYMELDEGHARRQLEVLGRCNVEGVAICLINAYVDPSHEERLRVLAADVLGKEVPVSISSETSPLAKEYARASTTVIDVIMKLIFVDYAQELADELRSAGFAGALNFADCAAGLMPWGHALAKPFPLVFAGPAAGTMCTARLGEAIEDPNLIGCDVGGTSTDVSLVVEGEPMVNSTFEIEHDLIINALSTEVSSVGAGGGSLISISASGDVQVGPESAGSEPGPACYGRGGTAPTITDACLLMGIISPNDFARGSLVLEPQLAVDAFAQLDTSLRFEDRVSFAYRLAAANIAEEIQRVVIRHGLDVRDFSLMAYGAAGPMLIPAALDLLKARRVIVPPHPGLFSAVGLLTSDLVYRESRSAYVVLTAGAAPKIAAVFAEMERSLIDRAGVAPGEAELRRSFDGRLVGQSWETPFVAMPDGAITADTVEQMIESFHDAYMRRYGNKFPAMQVEGVSYRIELIAPSEKHAFEPIAKNARNDAPAGKPIEISYLEPEPMLALEYQRDLLSPGDRLDGPAVIREGLATTFVQQSQLAEIGRFGEIVITQGP